jgi:hypothetical protein
MKSLLTKINRVTQKRVALVVSGPFFFEFFYFQFAKIYQNSVFVAYSLAYLRFLVKLGSKLDQKRCFWSFSAPSQFAVSIFAKERIYRE